VIGNLFEMLKDSIRGLFPHRAGFGV